MNFKRSGWAFIAAFMAPLSLAGCGGAVNKKAMRAFTHGDYADARLIIYQELPEVPEDKKGKRDVNESDRNFILARSRAAVATLADGHPYSAEDLCNDYYSLMTTQGVNEDKTIAAVMLVEDVRTWKGEPFEQAMAYIYVSIQKALRGDWGNARAAANESLFLLRDFGAVEGTGQPLSGTELVDAVDAKDKESAQEYLDGGYQPIETDFTLGYMQVGLTNLALGRRVEAQDNFQRAIRHDRSLRPVVDALLSGRSNTVAIVDCGKGPEKIRYGRDDVYSDYKARSVSDDRLLRALVNGRARGEFPAVADMNRMSQDHRWRNLEDMRRGKSIVGDVLVGAGAVTATYGAYNNDAGTMIVGGVIAILGLGAKASARADIRHNEFLPQRVYMVPMSVDQQDSEVRLEMNASGDPGWAVTLPAIDPPPSHTDIQILYVRVPIETQYLVWLDSGEVLYANEDYDKPVIGDGLPYILGGNCVREPSLASLRRYQAAGNLTGMTVTDLENLYAAEGISFDPRDTDGFADKHVLEGGTSMVAPVPGSIGYIRHFCQPHKPYKAKSEIGKELQAEYATYVASIGNGES